MDKAAAFKQLCCFNTHVTGRAATTLTCMELDGGRACRYLAAGTSRAMLKQIAAVILESESPAAEPVDGWL